MGLNTNFKDNGVNISIDNNAAYPQGTSSKVKINGSNYLSGTIFMSGRNQIPFSTYIPSIDVNFALEGCICYGGGATGEFSPGTYYIWYNRSTSALYWSTSFPSSGTYTTGNLLKQYSFTTLPETVKIYAFVQAGGGGGGGGTGGAVIGAGGGSGGGGGGAAFTPIFLTSSTSNDRWDYIVEINVGGGGSAGIGGKYHGGGGGSSSIVVKGIRAGFSVVSRTIASANGGGGGRTNTASDVVSGGAGGSASFEYVSTTGENLVNYVPKGLDIRSGFARSGAQGGHSDHSEGYSTGSYSTQLIDYDYMFGSSTRGGYSGGGNNDTGARSGGGGGASPNGPGGNSGKDKTAGSAPPRGYGGGGGGSSYKKPLIGTWYMDGGAGANGRAWVWA